MVSRSRGLGSALAIALATAPVGVGCTEVPADVTAEPDDAAAFLFDERVIRTYDLTLLPADLAVLEADPEAEVYVPATLAFEGETYPDRGRPLQGRGRHARNCFDADGQPHLRQALAEGQLQRARSRRRAPRPPQAQPPLDGARPDAACTTRSATGSSASRGPAGVAHGLRPRHGQRRGPRALRAGRERRRAVHARPLLRRRRGQPLQGASGRSTHRPDPYLDGARDQRGRGAERRAHRRASPASSPPPATPASSR